MTPLLVALGAALGAPTRYLADRAVQARHRTAVPWGTLLVNVVGSLLLGSVAAAVRLDGADAWLLTAVGTGFCGALTTFSTFGYETVRLLEERRWAVALGYSGASLSLGLAGCALGWWVVGLL